MKQVLLNNCDTKQVAQNWDEALVALKNYAHEKFNEDLPDRGEDEDERRELAFQRLLDKHELKVMPKLTAANTEVTDTAFIFYL